MKETIIINNESGLHARPASDLVNLLQNMDSEINIIREGTLANAKSIFNLMALGITKGDEIEVKVTGGNELDNLNEIINFFENLED